jgi:GT2 family glycosyltransferase
LETEIRSKKDTVINMKIAIGIATAGRKKILTDTIFFLKQQSRTADELLICPAAPHDLDPDCLPGFPSAVRILGGKVGASAQRNLLLNDSKADIMVFFDDDFLPAPDFLAKVEQLFSDNPEIVIATGNVLADGAIGPGFDHEEGKVLLRKMQSQTKTHTISQVFNGYGCNMAVRLAPVRSKNIRFDERLPRYSWLEDVDFSRQLATSGRIVKASSLEGVHLGTKKAGRSPGKSLGYSQIANRIYIMRKGNMTRKQVIEGNCKNIMANLLHSFRPEPWVDRRGRLVGNCLALWDWINGKVDPERILKF